MVQLRTPTIREIYEVAQKIYSGRTSEAGMEAFTSESIETVIRPGVRRYAALRKDDWDIPRVARTGKLIVGGLFDDCIAYVFSKKENVEQLISGKTHDALSAALFYVARMHPELRSDIKADSNGQIHRNTFMIDNPALREELLKNFDAIREQAVQFATNAEALAVLSLCNEKGLLSRIIKNGHEYNINRMMREMTEAHGKSLEIEMNTYGSPAWFVKFGACTQVPEI